eukprot:2454629-Amphidinium_carterae.1
MSVSCHMHAAAPYGRTLQLSLLCCKTSTPNPPPTAKKAVADDLLSNPRQMEGTLIFQQLVSLCGFTGFAAKHTKFLPARATHRGY